MKKISILVILLAGMLLLSACAKATPTSAIGSDIFTAVAQTLTAQYTPQEATATPFPTEAATQPVVPTVFATVVQPTAAVGACDGAEYVADVNYPDNTVVTPNTKFTKTWRLQNTGTCVWSADYTLTFYSGSQMGGSTVTIGKTVAPGSTIDISVNLTSPSAGGTYIGNWQMANSVGTSFGRIVYVKIVVSSTVTPTTTTTGTITTTPTRTFTPTQTPIYIVVTATPMPSSTNTTEPSQTPTPSETPTTSS